MISIDWEAVRTRHPLGDVARRTGFSVSDSGWAMVCCPLPQHDDRHPSMQLNLDESRYYCFGCGAHGDVIQWVRDVEGLRVTDAIEVLDARRLIHGTLSPGAQGRSYSSPDPVSSVDPERTPRPRVHEAMQAAWRYYTFRSLHDRATTYLKETRQIDVGPIEAANGGPVVGHTPVRVDGLSRRLLEEGFTPDELVDAALVRRLPDGRAIDFFRDRLLLPVIEADGAVAGIIGRSTLDRQPKYLNQTLTHTYDKSRNLYRPSIVPLDRDANAVVVEGTLDALAIAAQAAKIGLSAKYAPVSTSGLRLSDLQLDQVLAISPDVPPVLAADGDDAGRKASLEWARRIAQRGQDAYVTLWPSGHDPASWIAHFGWEGLVSVTQPRQRLAAYPPPDDIGPVLVSELLGGQYVRGQEPWGASSRCKYAAALSAAFEPAAQGSSMAPIEI